MCKDMISLVHLLIQAVVQKLLVGDLESWEPFVQLLSVVRQVGHDREVVVLASRADLLVGLQRERAASDGEQRNVSR